jgi:hypothetical protein
MNQKDLRILKLHRKGLNAVQIATKIGYGGANIPEGVKRVDEALKRYSPLCASKQSDIVEA